jgi:hypothetical protein
MDELDRLYRRLVHNIRVGFPELLTRTFEVSAIYQQIVPYRTNRRELGFDSNDEYELALCQLLSGARGLVTGDAEMREAMRRELEAPNPDLASYRSFATSQVSLAPEPLRDLMLRATPEAPRGASGTSSPAEMVAMAGRSTEASDTPPEVAAPVRPSPAPPPPPPPPTSAPRTTGAATSAPVPAARPAPRRAASDEKCRYCGTVLPEGRSVIFCPGCGHDLTVQHCPACNTELEVGWKFCITCGRDTRQG